MILSSKVYLPYPTTYTALETHPRASNRYIQHLHLLRMRHVAYQGCYSHCKRHDRACPYLPTIACKIHRVVNGSRMRSDRVSPKT
nr:MAG TPA: hypothetical protein [Caudoviricetes sp.]